MDKISSYIESKTFLGIVIYISYMILYSAWRWFYSWNMSLMINYKQSCVYTWFIFVLFTRPKLC